MGRATVGWVLLLALGCGRTGAFAGNADEGEGTSDGERELGCLLGYWSFDDAVGSTVVGGEGPQAGDGVVTGAVALPQGAFGAALVFDGDDDVSIAATGLEPNRSVSMTAWVRPRVLDTQWNTVISNGGLRDSLDRYWLGYYASGGRIHLSDGEADVSLRDDGDYGDHIDDWHHLAATFDGDTGEMVLYVDGVETGRRGQGPARLAYDGAPVRIGMDTNWGEPGWGFVGGIDEVKLFDCALDEDEIERDAVSNWPF